MTLSSENVTRFDAATASALRAKALEDARQLRSDALRVSAAALEKRESSVWEILYAAEWLLGAFEAATAWVPGDVTGEGELS